MNRKPRRGFLSLSDGQRFGGELIGPIQRPAIGEVVFNTGMTGYVESLTDPSYAGQLLVFTYPLIGNYGVQAAHSESPRIQVRGIIVSEASRNWSHSAAAGSLAAWLAAQSIPIISGVDTRDLTKHLRTRGTMLGAIDKKAVDVSGHQSDFKPFSVNQPKIYNRKYKKKVILVDCGVKNNILRSLMELPIQIKLVPHNYDYTREDYAGVLISNGPGDPIDYPETISIAAKALKIGRPLFGICLGSQIMGLAAGAKTYKLLFGHRGHNQPCIGSDGRCFITSQNHGYAIDEKSLPSAWKVSFRNLNDGSVEGIEHRSKPFFSVQFHPEACPGPTDTKWLFERFYQLV
jgi:carbamoyl-phosphate synthase small subunit